MTALVRLLQIGGGVLALAAGLALGSGGCGWCDCPDLDPVDPGVFEIIESEERPALLGGTVEAIGDTVTIEYVDEDGLAWTVVYDVVDKVE